MAERLNHFPALVGGAASSVRPDDQCRDGLIYSGRHDSLSVFGRLERPTFYPSLFRLRFEFALIVKKSAVMGTIIAIFAVVLWGRIGFDSDRSC